MDQERNLGVTEARFALTLLTCFLVAIGYIALLRLGGSKDTAVEPGPDDAPPSSIAPNDIEPQPLVLPIDKAEDRAIKRAARPSADSKRL